MSTQTAPLDPPLTVDRGIAAISPADAGHALWFFGGGPAALRPGHFDEHLLTAIAHADTTARAALRAAFPGPAALRPGHFDEHLLTAIAHADTTARAALRAAFPGPAAAVRLATEAPDGLRLLAAIAGGAR